MIQRLGLFFLLAMAVTLLLVRAEGQAQESAANSRTASLLSSLEELDKAVLFQREQEERAIERLSEIRERLISSRQGEKRMATALDIGKIRLQKRIRALYMYSGKGFVNALLGQSDTPHDVMIKVRYLLYVIDRDIDLFRLHSEELQGHQDMVSILENQQLELQAAATQAEQERILLEEERLKRSALLQDIQNRADLRAQAQQELVLANAQLDQRLTKSSTSRPGSNYAAIASLPKAGTDQNQALRPTAASLKKESQGQSSKATKTKQDSVNKTAPSVASTVPVPPSPFEAKRGRHFFPTTGKVTRGYGRYKVEGMLAPAFSKGLEIKAPSGTPFKAIASGQVQMADWFKGYGLMIILNHGNDYRSIYTHASKLLVQAGDEVQGGDIIGLVGDTGSLKGAYLYLELRRGKSPVNPMEWLRVPPNVLQLQ